MEITNTEIARQAGRQAGSSVTLSVYSTHTHEYVRILIACLLECKIIFTPVFVESVPSYYVKILRNEN